MKEEVQFLCLELRSLWKEDRIMSIMSFLLHEEGQWSSQTSQQGPQEARLSQGKAGNDRLPKEWSKPPRLLLGETLFIPGF